MAQTSLTSAPPVLIVEQAIATITLQRPAQHNRLSPADLETLSGMFETIDQDRAIRAVIITATGPSFCSGYDIGAFSSDPGQPVHARSGHDFNDVCDRLEAMRPPVICALNGSVYGGAIDFTLACDFRLGHADMLISMPAARLGIHYYASGLARYVSRLGLSASKRLLLTGNKMTAEELYRIGYLDEIVPAAHLLDQANQLARCLAENAPLAVQGMKHSLNAIAARQADAEKLNALFSQSLGSMDFIEGRTAWAEKRKAVFKGE